MRKFRQTTHSLLIVILMLPLGLLPACATSDPTESSPITLAVQIGSPPEDNPSADTESAVRCMLVLPDSSLMLGGMSFKGRRGAESVGWLKRLDASRNALWSKKLGRQAREINELIPLSNGNVLVVSLSILDNPEECKGYRFCESWLTEVTPAGAVVWEKSFGSHYDNVIFSVTEIQDSGFIITGKVVKKNCERDIWIAKTDSRGKVLQEALVPYEKKAIIIRKTQRLSNGRIVAVGDEWLACFDETGKQIWEKRLEEYKLGNELFVVDLRNGSFAVAGTLYRSNPQVIAGDDTWFNIYDYNGNRIVDSYFDACPERCTLLSMIVLPQNRFALSTTCIGGRPMLGKAHSGGPQSSDSLAA